MLKSSLGLFTFGIALFAVSAQVRVLQPTASFQLRQAAGLTEQAEVQNMRAGPAGLWFLVDSPSGNTLILTDLRGDVKRAITLPTQSRAVGLAATSSGAATVLVTNRRGVLTEYDAFESTICCMTWP